MEVYFIEVCFFSLHHPSFLVYAPPHRPPPRLGGLDTIFRKLVYSTFFISNRFFFSFLFFGPGILKRHLLLFLYFCVFYLYIVNAIKYHYKTLSSRWYWLPLEAICVMPSLVYLQCLISSMMIKALNIHFLS